jgi:predicted ATPase
MKKIVITGASGVGKTTLASLLAKELNLPVIPEIARDLCAQMGYKRIGDIPDQEKFKREVLKRQIEIEDKLGSFISDRSTIDCWVLWQRWNICTAMTHDSEQYYNQAKQQSEKYMRIIYVPPRLPPEDDEFRWTDLDYQKQVDRLVRMTLYDWQLLEKTHFVESVEINSRLNEILTLL